MSESKHTPGPWYTRSYAPYLVLNTPDWQENTVTIVDCRQPSVKAGYTAEEAANARLIAKSPELLTVLKEITPDECPIVTHHKPDCIWCRSLRLISEIEGEPDADTVSNL